MVEHWADTAAKRVLKEHPKKKEYVCASGITPSGVIHLGNFREIITTDLVYKGLKMLKKNCKMIYSWDDYDRFRKVPKDISKDFNKYIGYPVSEVPDPFKCHKNYAEHFEKELENSIKSLGFDIKFIRQNQMYKKCKYAKEIKFVLNKKDKIVEVLNKYRKEPLSDNWTPLTVYCEKCKTDFTKVVDYDGDYTVSYECKCGYSNKFDFRKKGICKLKWRSDWAMRWLYEDVSFEPAGKDHFAAGGSRETGVQIFDSLWNKNPPYGFMYEWIAVKGGGEFSSSAGVVITISELLEVYEPEIVRWIFAGSRPNARFEISFDLDVLKLYEDFDYCERVYFGKEKVSVKEKEKQKRIYELSSIKIPKKMHEQVGFRHLTILTQLYEGDLSKFKGRTKIRAKCAWNWVEKYAPESMKFKLVDKVKVKLDDKQREAIRLLTKKLKTKKYTNQSLFEECYRICEEIKIRNTDFFKGCYLVLIGKERGPKLTSLILSAGKGRILKIFGQI